MNSPVRRNDPCPCGSGLRFKECHGRLDAGGAGPSGGAGPDSHAALRHALQLHQQGHVDEAVRRYREVLEREPGNAVATHYLGLAAWHRGDLTEAERLMRAALERDASIPDFHSNLGLLLRDTARRDEAIASFRAALAADPKWFEAYNNLGLTLEAANRFAEACDAYREAIAREPGFAAARQNLGRALLTMGQYREGWEQYRWRLLAQGVLHSPPDPAAKPLPPSLAGRRLALRGEQGVGDALFFLRFAPELARRGARLAFRGDPRLHPLLDRTGYFDLGFAGDNDGADGMENVFVGTLPWFLEADEPARFPAALRLAPQPERVRRWREDLEKLGPAPYVGLAWRAGTVAPGPVSRQSKIVSAQRLGAQLRDREGTWISVQRLPQKGEREALELVLGATVHDLSMANNDLEDILALMSLLDDYVGVSNANVHLRAGLGLPMRVLVPFPPEWRWGLSGRSPWFPTAEVIRQRPDGSW